MRRSIATCIATVGEVGQIPWGPGTWGSLVGLLLGGLSTRVFGLSGREAVISLALSFLIGAWLCGRAERDWRRHDAPAIVLDEVWGMATVCLLLPATTLSWPRALIALAGFRLFDIAKPPPLQQLARLPGGWGIMADDLGASAYTLLLFILLRRLGLV